MVHLDVLLRGGYDNWMVLKSARVKDLVALEIPPAHARLISKTCRGLGGTAAKGKAEEEEEEEEEEAEEAEEEEEDEADEDDAEEDGDGEDDDEGGEEGGEGGGPAQQDAHRDSFEVVV